MIGLFSCTPARRGQLFASASAGALLFAPATAFSQTQEAPAPVEQETDTAGQAGDEVVYDDIVVTGQAVPGAVVGDIPPENQLNPRDIASFGVSTVSELLDEIADQTQSGMGRSGSGPVILVNGKRASGVKEISDLPTEAVLRVDILPEEVALKYGYGASQKVVNVILRRFFRSMVADVRGEMATEGQGEEGRGHFIFTKIRNNNRLNIFARVSGDEALLESERNVAAVNRTATDPTGTMADEATVRTLRPKSRDYSVHGVYSHEVSKKVTAVVNMGLAHSISDSLQGYASDSLTVPASNPFAQSSSDQVVDRYLSDRVLGQNSKTTQFDSGLSVNASLPKEWQLSLTGNYSHSDSNTGTDRGYDSDALQSAITAGDPSVDPYGLFSSALLGDVLRDKSIAKSDTGGASLMAMGKLFKLPAGDVRTSISVGGTASGSESEVTRNGIATSSSSLSRSEYTSQISFDFPLTSRKSGFLGEVGTLTANFNASGTKVSNFGALGTIGYGLNWAPQSWVSLIASFNQDRSAPNLTQLNAPTVVTENVRVYDYVRGETAIVTSITGGNPDLKADDRHVFKLGVTVKPLSKLSLTANYIDSRTNNAISTLPSLTAAIEAAYPDRYVRNNGVLVQVDNRVLNIEREEQRQLRWGITFTKSLRNPTRPQRPAGAPPFGMRQGMGGGEGGPRSADGDTRQHSESADKGTEKSADTNDTQSREKGDIVVNGEKTPDNDDGPPPPPFGEGGPPPGGFDRGMGPPPGGFGGGMGPPPGGFGGGMGSGPRPNFSGGGNGASLQFSLFHSWYLRDRIILADGGPVVDLLDGGASGSSGGQPRHVIQFNGGLMDNGVGLRLSADWKSGTTVAAGSSTSSTSGDLHFSSLLTMDLRLFANMENRFSKEAWAKGMRVSFGIDNLFNKRQTVKDDTGATPLAYQKGYLDPVGRTVSLSIRKIF